MTTAPDQPGAPVAVGAAPPTSPVHAVPPLPGLIAPVAAAERLVQLDFLRGVALLGILIVNMGFFFHPFGKAMDPSWLEAVGTASRAAWSVVSALFAYKFISLFSMLFGFGVALQMAHVEEARRGAWGFAFRRFGTLAFIGAVHGVLIWYGDILFVYACLGMVLTAMRGLAARTLLIVAGCIAGVLVGLGALGAVGTIAGEALGGAGWAEAARSGGGGASGVDAVDGEGVSELMPWTPAAMLAQAEAVSLETDMDEYQPPFPEVRGLDAMIEGRFIPSGPEWMAGEAAAYREGPWEHALLFRATTWAMCVFLALVSYGWHALCMMLLGMWAYKVGIWKPECAALRRTIARIALGGGLPLTLISVALLWACDFDSAYAWAGFQFLHMLTALVLPAGYAMAIGSAARSLPALIVRPIACAGRMALTVYLCESLLATGCAYWWGLALFGSLTGFQCMALALCIWLVLVGCSTFWLRRFRMGPMEWVWRACTYGTLHPGAATSRSGPPAP